MARLLTGTALAGIVVCVSALLLAWPATRDAAALWEVRHDVSQLSQLQIEAALRRDPDLITRQIDQALADGDAELAQSLLDLAAAQKSFVPETTSRRVAEALAAQGRPTELAKRFAAGLFTGEASDVASLSGTMTGDLLVVGDIRDVVREGKRIVDGQEPDRLVLGLATAGLAVTAATFATVGGAAPARAGLTMVKDARKLGRLGEGLTRWAGRSTRELVDAPQLKRALSNASLSRPGDAIAAVGGAFRAEKAGALLRVAKDVGRIGNKVGTRGAMDVLKIAEGPKDIARAARLAEAQGGKTRAILKLLGRGALLLTFGAFNFTWWMLGALFALFGVVGSVKAGTERLTRAAIAKWRRHRAAQLARRDQPLAKPAVALPPMPPMPLAALNRPG
uniref:Uncharacterized protein n=1 Tax=Rhodopseudomonas palustris (strain BisA53) TaxID=316055 RepID=Q07P84_RHOP5